jgi:hypothetical protein
MPSYVHRLTTKVTLIKSVREICALSRGSWFVVRGSSGGVRYHRADRVWATAVQIALSSGHVRESP